MQIFLNDRSASALFSLGIVVLVVGGFLFLGNAGLEAVGLKDKSGAKFEKECKAHGGQKADWTMKKCYVNYSGHRYEVPMKYDNGEYRYDAEGAEFLRQNCRPIDYHGNTPFRQVWHPDTGVCERPDGPH
jgi:hypothetical protein